MKPEDVPCPVCEEFALVIEMRLESKPLGTFSVSGMQLKTSAYNWPYLVCKNCGVTARAKEET